MIAFPIMLVEAAYQANMSVPPDPDKFEEVKDEYPHFYVYCILQLARPIRMGEHWDNAKVIAGIPLQQLKTMNLEDFIAKGLEYHEH